MNQMTPSDVIVETQNLSKVFAANANKPRRFVGAVVAGVSGLLRSPRKRKVVDSINLSILRGQFFGIVGPNGAGKTTFLKLLSCLIYPDGGSGSVNGFDILRERTAVRRSISISPAQAWNGVGILWQLTGRDNLLFRARMCGVNGTEARKRADYVVERLGFAEKARDHTWNWSAGELHKLTLAMTFMAHTPIVILDEPTSHLDPRVARLIREFAKEELNKRNRQTVIISTHYLEEAEHLCDQVAVLQEGKLLACNSPAKLKAAYVPDPILEIRALNYTPRIGQRIAEKCHLKELLEQFEDITTGQVKLRPKWPDTSADVDLLCQELKTDGVEILSVRKVEPSLDDVYFQLTKGDSK